MDRMDKNLAIEGSIVTLRPFSLKDVSDAYIGWLNDKEVNKYNSHGDTLYTREQAVEYVTRVSTSSEYCVLAIWANDTGKHIGNISLQSIDTKNKSAEYAIIIGDKDYWGKGVAKEASRLIIEHGFEKLGLHRIYCGTSVENVPMQKLAAALGFREEGTRKEAMFKDGKFVDVLEYGMLPKDFKRV